MNFPRLFLSSILLISSVTCTKPPEMNEEILQSQLEGKSCVYIEDDTVYNSYLINADYQPQCRNLGILDRWNKRSFKALCVVSGAVCLLALSSRSAKAQTRLEDFLLTGPNDIDTGDGIFSIRGTVALVYGLIAKKSSEPILRKSLERNDPARRSDSGAFPANYKFETGTSRKLILQAIQLSSE